MEEDRKPKRHAVVNDYIIPPFARLDLDVIFQTRDPLICEHPRLGAVVP